MILTGLTKYRDFGLLFLRIGLGLMMFFHGLPKLQGGPEMWAKVGGAMALIGIDFLPAFWGFMAAFTETAGGILLIAGFLFRPAALLLSFTMLMAFVMHFKSGDSFGTWSHAVELAIVFVSLVLIGPGRFSVDRS